MSATSDNLEKCHPCARAAGTVPDCPASGAPLLDHAKHGYCPRVEGPLFGDGRVPLTWKSRGLGDTIGKITAVVGITPCRKCKERQAAINGAVRYAPPHSESV